MYHRTLRNSEEGGPKKLGMGWEGKEENCDCEEEKSCTQAVKLDGESRFGWSEFELSHLASKEESMGSSTGVLLKLFCLPE